MHNFYRVYFPHIFQMEKAKPHIPIPARCIYLMLKPPELPTLSKICEDFIMNPCFTYTVSLFLECPSHYVFLGNLYLFLRSICEVASCSLPDSTDRGTLFFFLSTPVSSCPSCYHTTGHILVLIICFHVCFSLWFVTGKGGNLFIFKLQNPAKMLHTV